MTCSCGRPPTTGLGLCCFLDGQRMWTSQTAVSRDHGCWRNPWDAAVLRLGAMPPGVQELNLLSERPEPYIKDAGTAPAHDALGRPPWSRATGTSKTQSDERQGWLRPGRVRQERSTSTLSPNRAAFRTRPV